MAADVCIIGAGPAGLAVARALAARGISYRHLERHHGVGGIWDIDNPGSPMYDSAHFISSKTLSAFSGFPMPADYPDYPSHRQILAYLRGFADAYRLRERIEFDAEVTSVRGHGQGWEVRTAAGKGSRHKAVVVCTGPQWVPHMPTLPGRFSGEVRHSRDYRDAADFAGKRVLVVGGGNSACDIACDAARVAEQATISMRRGYWFIPKHIFGMPADVFGEEGPHLPARVQQIVFERMLRLLIGDPARLGLQRPDHRLFETHPVLNSMLLHHLQHGDITAAPGIADIDGSRVTFTDGTGRDVDLIVMATGYRHEVPVAADLLGEEQQPDLYLGCFSRLHPGFAGVGFLETNSGAYRVFDAQAHLIAAHWGDVLEGAGRSREFAARIRTDRPDLSGGIRFDSSPRHRGYVDSSALRAHLARVAGEHGWTLEAAEPAGAAVAADRVTQESVAPR